jgi:hypothetical protein
MRDHTVQFPDRRVHPFDDADELTETRSATGRVAMCRHVDGQNAETAIDERRHEPFELCGGPGPPMNQQNRRALTPASQPKSFRAEPQGLSVGLLFEVARGAHVWRQKARCGPCGNRARQVRLGRAP